jgi:hypothetical protein
MFFSADEAARRLGLPGINIHIFLDLGSRLEVEGFRRALAALCRVYPAVAARREISLLTGHPRWRLDTPEPDLRRVVRVHTVEPVTEHELHRRIEDVCATRIDLDRLAPVQFHIFRGLPRGDVLLMRWPHALMDARGGMFIVEEIDRLHRETPDPDTLASARDEDRDDYSAIFAGVPFARRVGMILDRTRGADQPSGAVRRLTLKSASPRCGRLRYVWRPLTPLQTLHVRDNALRICGFGRFGDHLRACAIHALHQAMPKPANSMEVYTTLNLIDSRKRRQRGPVCRNLTSALPLAVPVRLADERRAVADLIRDQMLVHIESQETLRQCVALSMLMRVPTAIAAAVAKRGWVSKKPRSAGWGLAPTPSLPLGFVGPFARPMPTFCGIELSNYYGFATARPLPGFAVDVNATEDRMNITASCFESSVPTEALATLVDRIVAALLDPSPA